MTPRKDPETKPQLAGFQVIKRGRADKYGAERGYRGHAREARLRPIMTRNGLPFRPYVYRGTGESMTFSEAKECLLCSD